MKNLLLLTLISLSFACVKTENKEINESTKLPDQPNILWLVAEDMSPVIESFGDSTIKTPNLNRLAREGIRFTNFYSTHGVCAPSRSAIATGMYPASIGTNHMRTRGNPDYLSEGIILYDAVIPPEVKMHSEYLRMAGYYCTNNAKLDYQFKAPLTAWDQNNNKAHWRNRPEGKPFFSIFNFNVCHESGMWRNKDHELLADPSNVVVPPYYPDNQIVRNELARMYSNVVEMDQQVGKILDQLEEDGLLENTIIFWYTDHGGPLPRQKREIYDSGLKVPMMVRFPGKMGAGQINDDLISFIDLKPTIMSLANIPIPSYLHGQAFLGSQKSEKPRDYIYAARDRLDSEYDRVRAVRDKRFKYIKNYQPEKPNIMNIKYRKQMTLMQELYRLDSLGELKGPQKLFFSKSKPEEELYDCEADPYEINNLAQDQEYESILLEMRQKHLDWVDKFGDKGAMNEPDLIKEMWPGFIQPATGKPLIKNTDGEIEITCSTPGASIAYQIILEGEENNKWQVYTKPISNPGNGKLISVAQRIGFAKSEEVSEILD